MSFVVARGEASGRPAGGLGMRPSEAGLEEALLVLPEVNACCAGACEGESLAPNAGESGNELDGGGGGGGGSGDGCTAGAIQALCDCCCCMTGSMDAAL